MGGGTIECGGSVVAAKADSGDPTHPHYFEVTMPTRTYMLASASAKDVDEWIELIIAPPAADDEGKQQANIGGSHRDTHAESIISMASFTANGPLNEVYSGWMRK